MKIGQTVKGWHFVGETLRDGRPIPPDGETLIHEGDVTICRSGLHASERVIDALTYAPGSTVCRVELGNVRAFQDDKMVGRARTILWRVDAEGLLRAFARHCALDVIDRWDPPDVVRRYLETGDDALRAEAARSAAWSAAAWSAAAAAAARSAAAAAAAAAAEAAAEAAAAEAARSAAWSAAAWSAAAWSAAAAAARSAAAAAAWSDQNARLEEMIRTEAGR